MNHEFWNFDLAILFYEAKKDEFLIFSNSSGTETILNPKIYKKDFQACYFHLATVLHNTV